MRGKQFYFAFICIIGLGFATSAFAALSNPFGWYGEVNAGGANISGRHERFDLIQDNSNWGGNINIGYKFMPYFGMEIGGFGIANSNLKVRRPFDRFLIDGRRFDGRPFDGRPFDGCPFGGCSFNGCGFGGCPFGGPFNGCGGGTCGPFDNNFDRFCHNDITVARIRNFAYGLAFRGIAPISCSGFELFAKVGVLHLQEQVDVRREFRCFDFIPRNRSRSSTGAWLGIGAQYYFTPEIAVNLQWQQARGNNNTGTFNFYTIGFSYLSYY